ncbi:twitching motility protein PilT [Verrucomicrobiota bacterium]|nr:twitching motility protein PilT [Verrucomicrobiota bacterium]
MKITVDLNVLLDVAQNRVPHYQASEGVLHRARTGEFAAVLPGHALTTLHFLIEKWSDTALANQTIDGLLRDFAIHSADKANFQRARQLPLKDFEDAVVAAVAEATGSQYIVTRNIADFSGSPVPAITSAEFLEELAGLEAE